MVIDPLTPYTPSPTREARGKCSSNTPKLTIEEPSHFPHARRGETAQQTTSIFCVSSPPRPLDTGEGVPAKMQVSPRNYDATSEVS